MVANMMLDCVLLSVLSAWRMVYCEMIQSNKRNKKLAGNDVIKCFCFHTEFAFSSFPRNQL